MTLEFVWTAESFEDLFADQAAEQHDEVFEQIVNAQDFDVWAYLNQMEWAAMEADPNWKEPK